jgi:hypothetical protein
MIAFVGGVASIGPLYPIASVKYGKAPQWSKWKCETITKSIRFVKSILFPY